MKAMEFQNSQNFRVYCDAGNSDRHEVATDSLLLQIEQQIRRNGKDEMWVSLQVKGRKQPDGSLAIQVVIFNPDWDEPLRIASIQSNPNNGHCTAPALQCDLEQRQL